MPEPRLTFFYFSLILLTLLSLNNRICAQNGNRPVIVIPGITGSQLVNRETGENVWFSVRPTETDDLRLPMSTDFRQNSDKLVATDIIRAVELPSVLPDIEVYKEVLDAFKTQGYAEGDWNNPAAENVYYVFPYDWRRDNVESAAKLIDKIAGVKIKLNRPDLKFNIVAHSMGGLVARYAAMYGATDLPRNGKTPVPNWTGARHIEKIMMFGTPNEGSMSGFLPILNGYPIAGINLPFINDISQEDVFSMPALYQLMPSSQTARFLDEDLKPLKVDLYDPATWRKYGWGAINNPKFLGKLKDAARINGVEPIRQQTFKTIDDEILAETTYDAANDFFKAVLERARAFQQALNAPVSASPIEMLAYGSECEPTLDAVLLIRDRKRNRWRTIASPTNYRTEKGRKITDEAVREAIYAPGDGRVTRRSLLAESVVSSKGGNSIVKAAFPVKSSFFSCELHFSLLSNPKIQEKFLPALAAKATN